MSEIGEGEQPRQLRAKGQSAQSNEPRGIPFTFLTGRQAENTEGRKGEAYPPEVYLRVIDSLEQIFFEASHRQEIKTLRMACLVSSKVRIGQFSQ
jgi:hypothetical protein